MTTATTTCSYSNPVLYSGGTPLTNLEAWNFASSSCITEAQADASSSIYAAKGFTYGEVVNSVELFLIFSILFYAFIWWSVGGFKIKQ